MNFVVHTYGADTPHARKQNIPFRVNAATAGDAEAAAMHARPLSHLSMTLSVLRKTNYKRAFGQFAVFESEAPSAERSFEVTGKFRGFHPLRYRAQSGAQAIATMKLLAASRFEPMAKTTAHGITELLTLAQMLDIYGDDTTQEASA